MSEAYIQDHFDDIRKFASVIEKRVDDGDCTMESVLRDNAQMLEKCIRHGAEYILIDKKYQVDMEL